MIRTQLFAIGWLGNGTEFLPDVATLEAAVKAARARVRKEGGAAHAVLTNEYAALVGTVVNDRGKVRTKLAKGRR